VKVEHKVVLVAVTQIWLVLLFSLWCGYFDKFLLMILMSSSAGVALVGAIHGFMTMRHFQNLCLLHAN